MTPKFKAGDRPFIVAVDKNHDEYCIVNVEIVSLYCRLAKRSKKPYIMAYFAIVPAYEGSYGSFKDVLYIHEPNLWQTFEEAVKNQHKLSSWILVERNPY